MQVLFRARGFLLCNELQGAKLIGKDKRRTPGPFERSLLAGQQAAIAPVGANGEVGYAATMKQWGIERKHTSAVWSLIVVRFKKLCLSDETVAAPAPPLLLRLTGDGDPRWLRTCCVLIILYIINI